ncbi:MAG TPA: hypothetical protein VFR76_07680, partial [Verrucomicrobiae bacterium]|nr:hypothetical protein [Verrucomicrobiae bacterium]
MIAGTKMLLSGKSFASRTTALELPLTWPTKNGSSHESLNVELATFREFGVKTRAIETKFTKVNGAIQSVSTFVNEFWTARQRQASSLHEVSYRACF